MCVIPLWRCACCFNNGKPTCTYEDWAAQPKHLSAHTELLKQASSFQSYLFDPITTPLSDGTVSRGGYRPLWPMKCAGFMVAGDPWCLHCDALAGNNRQDYGPALGMPPFRSVLSTALSSCVMGRKKKVVRINATLDAQSAPTSIESLLQPWEEDVNDLQAQVKTLQHNLNNQEKLLCSQLVSSIGLEEGLVIQLQMSQQLVTTIKNNLDFEKTMQQEKHMAHSAETRSLHFKMEDLATGLKEVMTQLNSSLEAHAELKVEFDTLQRAHTALGDEHRALLLAFKAQSAELLLAAARQQFDESSMTPAQRAFFTSWNKRCVKTRGSKMDGVMVDLAILATFDMSQQTYNTFRPFLNLPHYDWAVKLRKHHELYLKYNVGHTQAAYVLGKSIFDTSVIVTSSDGTRITRGVDVLHNECLVGRCYPPDVRNWPVSHDLVPGDLGLLKTYIDTCRQSPTILAHELCTVAAHCVTSNDTKFLPLAFFPEPTFGFSSHHHQLLIWDVTKRVWDAGIHSFGDTTDSCSTGISAGAEIMTPTNAKMQFFRAWLGLEGVPGFRYWSPLVACGVPGVPAASLVVAPNTQLYHESWFSWYGETLHTSRNLRKGCGAGTRRLVTGIMDTLVERIAMLSELEVVAKALENIGASDLLTSFKDMYTVKDFRDQNSKAAFAFISMPTMDACVRARGTAAYPLLLYMAIGFYLFEPWFNPKFTDPWMIAHFSWTAKLLLDKLERHVELYGLDKNLYLLSGTTRRTMDTMCHTSIHHILKGFRKASQGAFKLTTHWLELSLKKVNTNPLEGYHGACRTHGNDFNKTLAEWINLVNIMVIKQNLRDSLAAQYAFTAAAPRNRQMKQREPTLFAPISEATAKVLGTAGAVTAADLLYQGGGTFAPPHVRGPFHNYKALHDAMVDGCKQAESNCNSIFEHLAPEATEAMKEHHCFDKVKEWHGRPQGFSALIVMGDANPVKPFDPVTPDAIATLYNMDSEATEHGADAENVVDEDVDGPWELCADTKSKSHQEAIGHFNALMTLNTLIKESGNYAIKGKSGLCVQCADGAWVPLAKALAVWQWREWVSRERGPRFWVGVLPEHRKLPPGHNCTLGTLLVIALSPGVIALVRVHRIDKSGAEFGVKSCKLLPGAQNVLLAAELCWRTSKVGDSGTDFTASGMFLPSVRGNQVLTISPPIAPATKGSNNAVMDVSMYVAHGTFISQDGFRSLRSQHPTISPNDAEDADNTMDGADIVLCCRCSKGWWSDETGKLVLCSGTCLRMFHPSCAEVNTNQVDWQCMRCSGVDDAVCTSCDKEWYCDQKEAEDGTPNEYYTGAMLQCCGDNCGLWFHQQCHQPKIDDTYVARMTVKSGSKGKRGNWAGKPWRCDACKEHNSAGAIKKPRKSIGAPSVDPTMTNAPQPPPQARDWLCMSCNTITPIESTLCSQPTCQKPYAHFGVNRVDDNLLPKGRASARHKAQTVHDGMVTWGDAGTRVSENNSNREKIHSGMVNPVPEESIVPERDAVDVTDIALQWSCMACNTITSTNSDVCSQQTCRKSRLLFGLDAPSGEQGARKRASRHIN